MANGNQTTGGQAAIVGTRKNLRSILERDDVIQSISAIADKCMSVESTREQTLLAVYEEPKLLQCDPVSLIAAVRCVAQIGLPFAGPGALAHLVPYGRKVNVIENYRGQCALARRSGAVKSIWARLVFEKDEFQVFYGSAEKIVHKPYIGGDRGKIVAVYAVAQIKGGIHQFEVMSIDEVESIRKRSRMGNSGPWQTDRGEMIKKTAIRRLVKFLPNLGDIMPTAQISEDDETRESKTIESEVVPSFDLDKPPVDTTTGEVLGAGAVQGFASEKEHLLNQIRDELVARWPGKSPESKSQKLDELRYMFGVGSWAEVCALSDDILIVGLGEIRRRAAQEDIPADEPQASGPDAEAAGGPSDLDAKKGKIINSICTELSRLHPEDTPESQASRLRLLQHVFGQVVLDKIADLPAEIIKTGLKWLKDQPAAEVGDGDVVV